MSFPLLPAGLLYSLCNVPFRVASLWLVRHGRLYVGDWDDKDAFCNTVRLGLGAVCSSLGLLGIAEWAEGFFGGLRVRVVTPFGLGHPYRMAHRGGGGTRGWYGGGGCTDAWIGPACGSIKVSWTRRWTPPPSSPWPPLSTPCVYVHRVMPVCGSWRCLSVTTLARLEKRPRGWIECSGPTVTPNGRLVAPLTGSSRRAFASHWKRVPFGINPGPGTPSSVLGGGRTRVCRRRGFPFFRLRPRQTSSGGWSSGCIASCVR